MTTQGWFSLEAAIRGGVSVYRAADGRSVSVTRTGAEGRGPADEQYVGEVITAEQGGCVWPKLWGSYRSVRAARRASRRVRANWTRSTATDAPHAPN